MSDKFSISPTEIQRTDGTKAWTQPDFVVVEEPLEIKLIIGSSPDEKPLSITMRTPGNDVNLAVGFLFSEGIIKNRQELDHMTQGNDPNENVIIAKLQPHISVDLVKLERHFYTTSSCGVCGKTSMEAVEQQCNIELPKTQWKIEPNILYTLPDTLRAQQSNFDQTGGIHGCGLFDLLGNLIHTSEDVGRHNALDKLIGHFVLSTPSASNQIPLCDHILLLSGRISFELVQKAAMAGIRMIAAVGAPSSLAIDLAEDMGITLVGFLRGERCNIYTHSQRVVTKSTD
ncbi:MAG: formate dehydrogenase accessory sulfurtransferase FdhD [Flavobacteriaceae bacterium]|nr:formate dehydrogenase accessory sulfurtransferase FdhD [Flavobacteriaceae bacterium]